MKGRNTKKLVTSAMLIALGTAISFICELIPFLNLPVGGTVTVGSLFPVVLISYMYGIKWGTASGFVYAILQMAIGTRTVAALFTPTDDSYMGYRIALLVIFIDYICAFTAVGLGGIFAKMRSKTAALVLGSIFSLGLCYFFHTLSGAIFYGAWAEWFFTDTFIANTAFARHILSKFSGASLSWIYSACYNGLYMIPEILITALISVPVSKLKTVKRI